VVINFSNPKPNWKGSVYFTADFLVATDRLVLFVLLVRRNLN